MIKVNIYRFNDDGEFILFKKEVMISTVEQEKEQPYDDESTDELIDQENK